MVVFLTAFHTFSEISARSLGNSKQKPDTWFGAVGMSHIFEGSADRTFRIFTQNWPTCWECHASQMIRNSNMFSMYIFSFCLQMYFENPNNWNPFLHCKKEQLLEYLPPQYSVDAQSLFGIFQCVRNSAKRCPRSMIPKSKCPNSGVPIPLENRAPVQLKLSQSKVEKTHFSFKVEVAAPGDYFVQAWAQRSRKFHSMA